MLLRIILRAIVRNSGPIWGPIIAGAFTLLIGLLFFFPAVADLPNVGSESDSVTIIALILSLFALALGGFEIYLGIRRAYSRRQQQADTKNH